jgi:hypothetical protein
MKALREIHFEKAADVPNSALPVLLYRAALAAQDFEKHSTGMVGLVCGPIRFTITRISTPTHEVL